MPPKWWELKKNQEFASAIAALIGVLSQIIRETTRQPGQVNEPNPWAVLSYICLFVAVGVLGYTRLRVGLRDDQKQAELESPVGFRGSALVIYHLLLAAYDIDTPKDGEFRVTLYAVRKEGDTEFLEQVIEYVGSKSEKKIGRKLPINAGVIGQAFLMKGIAIANRTAADEDSDGYIKEIVEEQRFPVAMAEKMSLDRQSFFAAPIFSNDGETVSAILYADSSIKEAFQPILGILKASSEALASYIEERYPENG